MGAAHRKDWRKEFGLDVRAAPNFFSGSGDVDAAGNAAPQPLLLRRAFEQLKLDGVLCQDRAPIIYFRVVAKIESSEVARIQRLFWNQGVAPILVLIDENEVHVYSSLAQPKRATTDQPQASGFVEKLNRVGDELQRFILSVESGDYFRANRKSFDPRHRVDRSLLRNLQDARAQLDRVPAPRLAPQVLDALLCRLVFTCYLFDRGVIDDAYLEDIGIPRAQHLRDVLGLKPSTQAKTHLYQLFAQLGRDFNGDLFSDDLDAEARQVKAEHLDILHRFFTATEMLSGQQSLWPYDFGIIPIETVSAIYEQFLKLTDAKDKKNSGAFFTPRFLAELVLDLALDGTTSLTERRFLDPACGSGIFLVGLFNRLAEAWNRANPKARYDRRAAGLMRLLSENLYGIDSKPTACRITAFSLYLAFLDQLAPPDIRQLQRKGKVLPRLARAGDGEPSDGGTIICADFFTDKAVLPHQIDLVIGNPPWASVPDRTAPVAAWIAERNLPFPNRQIADAFVWKAPEHLAAGGRVCFVLPHGTIFNHNAPALEFQRVWLKRHAVDLVLNLADYQRFLFEESGAPALVIRYTKEAPAGNGHSIDYWVPKTDWGASQAELITVLPMDRSRLPLREVLEALKNEDAPLIWKERSWATPRDRRLLNRLSLLPKLRDLIDQPSGGKREGWKIGEGFQPLGVNDDPTRPKTLTLSSDLFIEATSDKLDLVLLRQDCTTLHEQTLAVRRGRSERNNAVFRAPHVLITKGFSRVAYADFDVSFRHAVRGVHGPVEDRDLLIFLSAYLRSALARFYLFHTSSNWGVSRAEVHVDELLRLPFMRPHDSHDPARCRQILRKVAEVVTTAAGRASDQSVDRRKVISDAAAVTKKLVLEYFDVDDIELMLIADTDKIIIPSVRPTRARVDVPTLRASREADREAYIRLLCETLNGWASKLYEVHGEASASPALGLGLVVLEKTQRGKAPSWQGQASPDVFVTLNKLHRDAARNYPTIELMRGLKVFEGSLLYITKPLGQRFWSRTAALNDADDIAGTILMRSVKEGA